MSARGEAVPELGTLLEEIAGRIDTGTATASDASILRKVARQISGDDEHFNLRLHSKRRGAPRKGGIDVQRRFEAAKAIQEYRIEHGCSLDAAFAALDGKFGVGPDRLEDFWQEMEGLLNLDHDKREAILFFRKLEARGLVKVERKRLK